MKKRLLFAGLVVPVLAIAQEGEGTGDTPIPVEGEGVSFFSQYTGDLLMWSWICATLAMAYAVATLAFLALLSNRNPTLAARYALFWGGLAFILIHAFAFSALMGSSLDPMVVFLIAAGIVLVVIIMLALLRRKR